MLKKYYIKIYIYTFIMTSYIWSWFYPVDKVDNNLNENNNISECTNEKYVVLNENMQCIEKTLDKSFDQDLNQSENIKSVILEKNDDSISQTAVFARNYPYLDKVTNKPYILPSSMPTCMIPVTQNELNKAIKDLKKIDIPERNFVFKSPFAIELYNVCKQKGILA